MSATAVPLRPLKKGSVAKLWLALIVLSLLAVGAAWIGTERLQYRTTESGLRYQVVKEGSGPHPTDSDVALIDYTGKLADGTVFDSTKGKQPMPMPVNGSIAGFSEGLKLMTKGATYRFRIPSKLGYGSEAKKDPTGKVVIPANAQLDFEVTLIGFIPLTTYLQAMQGGMGGQGEPAAGPPPQ